MKSAFRSECNTSIISSNAPIHSLPPVPGEGPSLAAKTSIPFSSASGSTPPPHPESHLCFWQQKEDEEESDAIQSCDDVEEPMELQWRPHDEWGQLVIHRGGGPVDSCRYCRGHACTKKVSSGYRECLQATYL